MLQSSQRFQVVTLLWKEEHMATYLASWCVVDTYFGVVRELVSIEESLYVGDTSDVAEQVAIIAAKIRERLRSDPDYRNLLGISATSPETLNIIFQPPMTRIEI